MNGEVVGRKAMIIVDRKEAAVADTSIDNRHYLVLKQWTLAQTSEELSFVMGELLRQGFDAQLADRNTKGYDLLVGYQDEPSLRKVQVKSVRSAPWFVKLKDFKRGMLDRTTIYVLIGAPDGKKPVRYFITRNRDVKKHVHQPKTFKANGFMPMKAVEKFENRWDALTKS